MKTKDAKEYIEECRNEDGTLDESEIADLILWSYDNGRSQGRSESIEELKSDIMQLLCNAD